MITVLHFSLNGQQFITDAINIDGILKYTPDVVITNLPQYGSESTIGLLKNQDIIYHIKDSSQMLGYGREENANRQFIILFSNQLGLLVDSVNEVTSISNDRLSHSPIQSTYVKHVYIGADGNVLPLVDINFIPPVD